MLFITQHEKAENLIAAPVPSSIATYRKSEKSVSNPQRPNAISATKIWYTHPSIRILLFFPYSSSNSELKLLPIPTREKQGHISLDDETIMAIPDLTVAIPDTPWSTLPNEFPAIRPNFQAIAIVPSLILVPHETKECHVNRGHPKLESFKMKAEVLAKTVKYLPTKKEKEKKISKQKNQAVRSRVRQDQMLLSNGMLNQNKLVLGNHSMETRKFVYQVSWGLGHCGSAI